MNVLFPVALMGFLFAFLALVKVRPAILARRHGKVIFTGLQTTLFVAWIAVLGGQVYSIGFEHGGDIARRDARAEARAVALT